MRRSVVSIPLVIAVVIGLIAVGSVGAVGAVGSADQHTSQTLPADIDSYVVEQGDQCDEVVPLSSDETAAAFYDYKDHNSDLPSGTYSSHGTADLQQSDTSIIFLHEGSQGLSLVIVHDELDDGTDGSSVTFEIAGVPSDGEWTVEDDSYSGAEDDTFEHGDGWSEITWVWRTDRTDGAAFNGGLDAPFAITIEPAFNEKANYRWTENGHDGRISRWNALSSGAEQPNRIRLSLDDPIVIRSGTCDGPTVSHDRIDGGLAATISSGSDERAFVRPPIGSSSVVDFRYLAIDSTEDPIEVAITEPPADETAHRLERVTGTESLAALDIDGERTDVAGAELAFRVRSAHLDELDVDPDDVGLYEYVEGEWELAQTEPIDSEAANGSATDHVTYSATLSHATTVVVATQHPSVELVDVSLERERIAVGERAEITATVRNTGQAAGTYPIELEAFDEIVDRKLVSVGPGEEETITLDQRIDAPGRHELVVNRESFSVTVDARGTPTAEPADDPASIDVRSNVGFVTVGVGLATAIVLARRFLD